MAHQIDLPISTLASVIEGYISENAERFAREILDDLYVQCIAENHSSEQDNDGAEIVIRIKVPGTAECDRLVVSGEISNISFPSD